ncbi:DUF2975 domain-containing protein [Coprothermobacter platensis]|uniref:DUF2975 domain-containing protein n=1 Tax=Coprothermobacter platensis TaxID=108819 RepID=UPI00037B7038|nr:DUF2975 domain-containing protein [Coprothermobacter platensis]
MNQSSLSKWLKWILVVIGLCGLIVYAWVIPSLGKMLLSEYPEFSYCYVPWMILIGITVVPCYVVLVFGWKIAGNIGMDRSFSLENAKLLKQIAVFAAADAGFFFVMNVVYWFLNMNHPGIVLASITILLVGTAISAASAILSHLVGKAAELQKQSDLTI